MDYPTAEEINTEIMTLEETGDFPYEVLEKNWTLAEKISTAVSAVYQPTDLSFTPKPVQKVFLLLLYYMLYIV